MFIPQRRKILLTFSAVLLGNEVLQPFVLRLQLIDASFQRCDLVAHFLGRSLESLFTLLLLDAETGAGGGVASAFVFFGGEPGGVFVGFGLVGCFAFVGWRGRSIEGEGGGRRRRGGWREVGDAWGGSWCAMGRMDVFEGLVMCLEVEVWEGEVSYSRHCHISMILFPFRRHVNVVGIINKWYSSEPQ